MQYELTVKLLVETPHDEDRVTRQVESLFAFGTVSESFAEGVQGVERSTPEERLRDH